MTITIYGIPNCDQIKRTLAWFEEAGVAVAFHDYKKAGVGRALLEGWFSRNDWQAFLNRAGTTWRRLPDATKAGVTNADAAIDLMLANPSAIRRPVVVADGKVHVGYDPQAFSSLAAAATKR